MSQLHEFAQHKNEFDRRDVRLLAISVDNTTQGRRVWLKVVKRQFPVLSDPGAGTIRRYGLLPAGGDDGKRAAVENPRLVLLQYCSPYARIGIFPPRKIDRNPMQHRLRTLRAARGLTLRQISERTGLAISTLHVIEKHEREVSLTTALKLGHFYGMPVADIWRPLFRQICRQVANGKQVSSL